MSEKTATLIAPLKVQMYHTLTLERGGQAGVMDGAAPELLSISDLRVLRLMGELQIGPAMPGAHYQRYWVFEGLRPGRAIITLIKDGIDKEEIPVIVE